MNPPDDNVTADARGLAERIYGHRITLGFTEGVSEIAAVLAPVVRERDHFLALANSQKARAEAAEAAQVAAEREMAKMLGRLRGEHTDDCPFCAKTQGYGETQTAPMCHLCTVESDRDQLRETVRARTAQLDRICKEAFGYDDTVSMEHADDYAIRQVAKLRASIDAARSKKEGQGK